MCADTNANPQPDALSSLQWNDTRRLPNSHGGGNPQLMERNVQCGCWCRSVYSDGLGGSNADNTIGPAHAVYFATYEAVKHVMGGNQAGVHHPLAAGMFCVNSVSARLILIHLQPLPELAQQLRAMRS